MEDKLIKSISHNTFNTKLKQFTKLVLGISTVCMIIMFFSKLIFNCLICLIIYWIQTLENINKIVKSERDLSSEASEVDTASFW